MKAIELLDFANTIGKLKKVKRAAWIRMKISEGESSADHSFRVVVLAMVVAKAFKLDEGKLIKMAIIHDLGEIEIGDLVIARGKKIFKKQRAEKERKEAEAISKMFKNFDKEYDILFKEIT